MRSSQIAERIASNCRREDGTGHLLEQTPASIASRTALTTARYSSFVVSVTACTCARVTAFRTKGLRVVKNVTEKSSRSHAAAPRLRRGGGRAGERFPCMSCLREGLGRHTWVTRPSRRSICAVVCTGNPPKIDTQIGRTDRGSCLTAESVC